METLPLELITEILSLTTHKDLASARLVSSRFYEATLPSIFARKEKFVYNKHYNKRRFSIFTQTLLISKRKIYHLRIYHTDINNELETLLVKQGEFIESIRFKFCSINPNYFWKYINACINLKTLIFEHCNDHDLMDYALEHLDLGRFVCMSSVHDVSVRPCPKYSNLMSDVVKNVFPSVTHLSLYMDTSWYYHSANEMEMNADLLKYIRERSSTLQGIYIYSYPLVQNMLLTEIVYVSFANLKELHLTFYCSSDVDVLIAYIGSQRHKLEVCKLVLITNGVRIDLYADLFNNVIKLTGLKEFSLKGGSIDSLKCITNVMLITYEKPVAVINENLLEITLLLNFVYPGYVEWMVQSFPKLVVLSILYCKYAVTDDTIQLILRNLKNLKTLKLSSCILVSAKAFGNVCDGEQRLSFCESLKDLEHLNLALCPGLDDFSLTNYFKLPSLKSLSIFGCENVGEEGFKSLVDNHPYLESLNIGGTMVSFDTVVYLARSMKCLRILILQSKSLEIRSLLNTLLETSKCPEIVIFNGTGYRRFSDEAKYHRIKLDYPEYSYNWLQDAVMSI